MYTVCAAGVGAIDVVDFGGDMAPKLGPGGGDRLELLETFIRISDEGGIGAAARALETTQPTVTRRLQQLETLLDARLVERGSQGVGLTPAGASLLPEAREMSARWRGLEGVVHAHNVEIGGQVRVVAARDVGAEILPAMIAAYLEECPGVRVDLRFTDALVDLTAEGVDFWLREGRASQDGAATKALATIKWGLAVAPSRARLLEMERGVAIGRCEPLALEGAPLIATPRTPRGIARFHARDGSGAVGGGMEVRFEVVASADALAPAVDLALAGVGLVALPEWRMRPLVDDGRLLRAGVDWITEEQPLSLVWSPTRFRSAAASTLFDLIQGEAPAALTGGDDAR